MIKRISAVLFVVFYSLIINAQQALVKGMKITKTTKIKPGVYKLDARDSLDQPVIIIEGKNITIDFGNATLKGSNTKKNPDDFFGTGIIIRNSENVTIKNLKARGYKVALLAKNVKKLTLENCDFSYNYRKRLNSSQEKEDVSDWMSYHHNEKDEWLRYGAAMYLRNCDFLTIKNCKITGGQNALMMTECNGGMIYNNDFSFNSGIGIGMYRSSDNRILHNKLNFNVRGYSHGVYNRGQDSAGILIYEQSNNNIFYKNSATHSGDGFFLWAGQTTMDTGEGGCNGNFISENDFSYAPTNGIEVTFSQNTITNNRIFECDHGIWGGYSSNTVIRNNKFRNNRIGIAIEHGQKNTIANNLFSGDKEAIRLWARKEQPADWGYAKNRDTKSRDYEIVYNSFNRNPIVLNVNRTESLSFFNNTISGAETVLKTDSTVVGLDTTINEDIVLRYSMDSTEVNYNAPKPNDPFAGSGKLAGRKNILITEWGPYDFRSPMVWNTNPADTSGLMKFDLLGPKGKWVIKSFRGVQNISASKGEFPASITAQKIKGGATDIYIELQYIGSTITTPFGEVVAANKPYKFSFTKFFQPIDWEVLFYSLDTGNHNPLTKETLFSHLEKKAPFKIEKTGKLDYAWWGGIRGGDRQHTQFITMASGKANVPAGEYELSVTWDDVIRVYIDEKLVINEWNPALYKFDESPNKRIKVKLGGDHNFRVEHLELGGFATINLKLIKVSGK